MFQMLASFNRATTTKMMPTTFLLFISLFTFGLLQRYGTAVFAASFWDTLHFFVMNGMTI
jgi:hypothetical protein